jgi:hypothetical protein
MNNDVSEQDIIENIGSIVAGIRHYNDTGIELMQLLALQLGVEVSVIQKNFFAYLELPKIGKPSSGYLENTVWHYFFTDINKCLFTNTSVNQIVRVLFMSNTQVGLLSPLTIKHFVQTTPILEDLMPFLGENDAVFMSFAVLKKQSIIVETPLYPQDYYAEINISPGTGLVLAEAYR